jgi:hypothetical protein
MLGCGIAFMQVKLVLREAFVIDVHHAIPGHFSQDGRGSYREGELVALNDRSLRNGYGREVEGIKKKIIRRDG